MSSKVPRSFGTHNGTFHADEVTACALLAVFGRIDLDKVVRTREAQGLESCEYVCDVGGSYDPKKKLFDHHQASYEGELSSAGMILDYLHHDQALTLAEYHLLRDHLVIGVDLHDNGRPPNVPGTCTFSEVVSNFNPIRYNPSQEEQNRAFFEAVHFAMGHIQRTIDRHHYILSCRKTVEKSMKDQGHCLIFSEGIPWMESFFDLGGEEHPAQFIIMPTGDHWKLRGIPPSLEKSMCVRYPLPEEWAGHLDDDLKKISGINGAIFCHKGRFISVWETKEDALQALEYTLNLEKRKSS